MKKQSKILVAFLAALFSDATLAADYDASVRLGVGYSDNIARVSENEVDESILTAGFNFSVSEDTRRLMLNLTSNFDYLDYTDDTFDAEWVGGLTGTATISLVEERLVWNVADNFGQELLDPLRPAGPGNREDINFFSTGPVLSLLTGGRNQLQIGATYSNVSYEERPYDNDRLRGSLLIGRDVSRNSNLSLNVTTEEIEYDNDGLTPDFDRDEVFLSYETTGANSSVTIDLGYNEVDVEGKTGDGLLANISWTRQVSANGLFSLSGGSRYSDQGNIFRLYQGIGGDLSETADTSGYGLPFTNNFATIGYGIDQDRYSVHLLAAWSQEDYDDPMGEDRDLSGARATFQRDITRSVSAGAIIEFRRRDYQEVDRRDDDLILGLNLGYQFTAGFSVRVDYVHTQRDSDSPGSEFTENRVFLRASYIPKWSR